MSSRPLDPLSITCYVLQARAQEFVAWFEKWLQTSDSNQPDRTAEMAKQGRECVVLRSIAVDVMVQVRERFGISASAELLQIDHYVKTLDVLLYSEKTQPSVGALLEAATRSVLGAVKNISERESPNPMTVTTIPQTSVANDRATGPLAVKPSRPLRLTARRLEILKTIAASETRLSKPRVVGAMNAQGQTTSVHTVRIELAKMTSAAWLDNPPSAHPRGYVITELGRSIMSEGSIDRSLETTSAKSEGL
jgi:hypothetical protein